MSKHLHYTIIKFFQSRMDGHSKVASFEDLSTDEFYIYRINRTGGLPPVIVWLSDAYRFTAGEFLARPRRPKIDYVLIVRPEATNEPMSEDREGIGVGNLSGFMGALNKRRVNEYSIPKRNK